MIGESLFLATEYLFLATFHVLEVISNAVIHLCTLLLLAIVEGAPIVWKLAETVSYTVIYLLGSVFDLVRVLFQLLVAIIQDAVFYLGMVLYSFIQCACVILETIASLNWFLYIEISCVAVSNATLYSLKFTYDALIFTTNILSSLVYYLATGVMTTTWFIVYHLTVGVYTIVLYSIAAVIVIAHGLQHIAQVLLSAGGVVANAVVIGGLILVMVYAYKRFSIGAMINGRPRERRPRREHPIRTDNFDGNLVRQRTVRNRDAMESSRDNTSADDEHLIRTDNFFYGDNQNLVRQRIVRNREPSRDNTSADHADLQTRVERLKENLLRAVEAKQCVVCLDRPRKLMIKPCNHYCVCTECVRKLHHCPMCMARISAAEVVYDV